MSLFLEEPGTSSSITYTGSTVSWTVGVLILTGSEALFRVPMVSSFSTVVRSTSSLICVILAAEVFKTCFGWFLALLFPV